MKERRSARDADADTAAVPAAPCRRRRRRRHSVSFSFNRPPSHAREREAQTIPSLRPPTHITQTDRSVFKPRQTWRAPGQRRRVASLRRRNLERAPRPSALRDCPPSAERGTTLCREETRPQGETATRNSSLACIDQRRVAKEEGGGGAKGGDEKRKGGGAGTHTRERERCRP